MKLGRRKPSETQSVQELSQALEPGHSENAENLSGGDLPIRSLLSDLLRDRQAFQPTELRLRKLTKNDFPRLAQSCSVLQCFPRPSTRQGIVLDISSSMLAVRASLEGT